MTSLNRQSQQNNYMFYVITLLAFALFVPLFIYRQFGLLDFWWWMSLNLLVLTGLGFLTDKDYWQLIRKDIRKHPSFKVFYGFASALVLYIIFFLGNILVRHIFDFAGGDIQNVYGFKGDAGLWRISLLMLLIIGPGEELFWRAYIQRKLAGKIGKTGGFLLATAIYTLVHVPTGNLILILAALVCGLFWGWLYMKYNSVLMNSVSHIVWDIAVFVLLPFSF